MTPNLELWLTKKCYFFLLGPCDLLDIEKDCGCQKRGFHSQNSVLKGFPVLPDNWCQQSKAKLHPEPWGPSEAWWQEPLSVLLYYYPLCKFFFLFNL